MRERERERLGEGGGDWRDSNGDTLLHKAKESVYVCVYIYIYACHVCTQICP